MKKIIREKVLESISKVALHTAKEEVNSACMFLGYQPKAPESTLKLKHDMKNKQ